MKRSLLYGHALGRDSVVFWCFFWLVFGWCFLVFCLCFSTHLDSVLEHLFDSALDHILGHISRYFAQFLGTCDHQMAPSSAICGARRRGDLDISYPPAF